jgi:hypothetical protein
MTPVVLQKSLTSKSGHGYPTEDNERAFGTFEKAVRRQVTLALSDLKRIVSPAVLVSRLGLKVHL